jgi:dienelactone hydrolase
MLISNNFQMNLKRILTSVLLIFILSFQTIFAFSINTELKQPDESGIWVRNYPTISKGLTSVIIKIRLTQPGNAYYVFYDQPIEDITAFRIKSDAINQDDADILKYGTINYPSVPGAVSVTVDGFDREQQINLYMVTETNNGGLIEEDIKEFHFSMHFKHRIVPLDSTSAPYGYLEYLPANYNGDNLKSFPLVVFLHGSGGVGNGRMDGLSNPNTCMREGLTRYLEMDMDLPAVIISPQTPSDWTPATINTFIEFLKSHYNVNPDKVIITGISMGGGGTWSYAVDYAKNLSAVIPLCGAWVGSNQTDYSQLAKVPVWAFHNDQDPTVSVSNTYTNINYLIKAGGHPYLSIFRSDDHSCALEAYYYPGLWDWAFAQEKGKGIMEYGILNVSKSNQSLQIDGHFDESAWNLYWNNFQSNLVESELNIPKFKLIWDQNYLYTGVTFIKDNVFNRDKEVRIFLNGDEKIGGNNPLSFTFNNSDQSVTSNINTEGILSKWAETDSTYNLEVALPFSKTLRPNPIVGDGFGFDIQINEINSSDGSIRNLFWNGNLKDPIDVRKFGSILLSSETNDQMTANQTVKNRSGLSLDQNFPNPFSQNSTIRYFIPKRELVTLKVYDSMGKEIKTLVNQIQNKGYYNLQIDAITLKNGIYWYKLQCGRTSLCRKFSVIN